MNRNLYYKLNFYKLFNTNKKIIDAKIYDNNKIVKNILFNDNIKFTKSDNIIINALRNKGIKIDINQCVNIIGYDLVYDLKSYVCMSYVLKDILERFNNSSKRLSFLENLFENEEIVIISSGPSSIDITDEEYKYISENYLIICIKYILETLLNKNIKPTFFLNNSYLSKNNVEYYYNLSKDITSIFGFDCNHKEYNKNIKHFIEIYLDNNNKNHLHNFSLLKKNIDCITWNIDKNNNTTYRALHVMCELAIPLCNHLGISKIYTVGWDLKKIGDKSYCDNNVSTHFFNTNTNINKTEFDYVPNIKKILNDMNIEIYKIKESPILLEYKNIFSMEKKYISVIFDEKIKFTKSDNIIINALRKKDIQIDVNNYINISDYDFAYDLNTYICMSTVLNNILKKFNTPNERILFLKDLFKNEEVVIISSGPSSANIIDSELRYICDNYITICVKYVLEILLEKNIKPTFYVYNKSLSKNNVEYYYELSKDITSIFALNNFHYKYNIKPLIEIYLRNIKSHLHNFGLLKKNIDCITWNTDKNKNKTFVCLHIMCELAIPLCIHLGISRIYTVGWDLKKVGDKTYVYDGMKNPYYSDNMKKNISEFDYVPNIKKILNDKNIEIYKIKESPILLEYKNIFP